MMHDMINIEVTNKCDYHCSFCPREKMTRPMGFMSDELFKKVADECAKEKIMEINFTGYGETFLDPKIIERIRYIKSNPDYNPLFTTTTNCSLLTPKINEQLIHSGLDEIRASVYSTDQMEYKKDQTFDLNRILGNLKDLQERKRKANTRMPYVVVCFIQGLHKERLKEYKEKIKGYVDEIMPDVGLHNFIYGRNYRTYKKTNYRIPCERPTKTIIVNWEGNLIPCPFDFDSKMALANVTNQTMREAVDSPKYRDFCKKLEKRRYNELPYCNICNEAYPYTIANRLKRFLYLRYRRPHHWQERIKFYNRLREEERIAQRNKA